MSEFFRPKLRSVEALQPYRLRTTWSTGEVLEVDVEPALGGIPALKKLIEPEDFAKFHLGEWGHGSEWVDSELGADNIYAWAKEQAGEVSHQMFDSWMHRNGLSLNTAAAALGTQRTRPRRGRRYPWAVPNPARLQTVDSVRQSLHRQNAQYLTYFAKSRQSTKK